MQIDRHGRLIDYLRISVTDRCNLRCFYCMPSGGVASVPRSDVLRHEEILKVARAALACGFKKFRLTGGEPLVRSGVVDLARRLSCLPGLASLTMTTNGTLLDQYAQDLRDAGVRRLNVSMDALQPEAYRSITRGGDFSAVMRGIDAARAAGFEDIKINAVVIRGINESEIPAFVRYSAETQMQVRFIEKMPFPGSPGEGVSGFEVKRRIGQLVELVPVDDEGGERVQAYNASDGGRFAFITPVTGPFCSSCNRLRLTATGLLRQCLLSETSVDLRPILRSDDGQFALEQAIRRAVQLKPLLPRGAVESSMNRVGG